MVSSTVILVAAVAALSPCSAFNPSKPLNSARLLNHAAPLKVAADASATSTKQSIDPDIAAQFTIQVCTSTSCCRKLQEQGLDQYYALGELYAHAQAANVENCMIIEDGGCQGGKNCKMGPCVAILHEDFDGNVGLDGMNSNELRERVFHNVLTDADSERVWNCMENAIQQMSEEESSAQE